MSWGDRKAPVRGPFAPLVPGAACVGSATRPERDQEVEMETEEIERHLHERSRHHDA